MPVSKTKMKNAAITAKMAALPSIPRELIDPFVTGPMTGEAVNTATAAFKKALIERVLGAELSRHLGYPSGTARLDDAANQRNGRSAKTVLTDDGPQRNPVMLPVSAALIALPFLFPFLAGPSTSALQLLFSWACVAILLSINGRSGAPSRPSWQALTWLASAALAVFLFRGSHSLSWLAVLGVIAVIALCATTGARMAATNNARALAWALLSAGLLNAVLGLLQYYGLAEPLVPWTTAPDLGQAYGNLRQRNQFATLLSMAMVALLWLYATSSTGARRRQQALLAALPLLLVAQAASTSRTGLLQLLLVVGTAAFMARRDGRLPPWWLLIACVPFYFLAGWALPHLAGGGVDEMVVRLREGAPPGHSRLLLWRNVLTLIAQHPWVGWGWGELSFAHYVTLYDGPRFVEILDNAHNLPLHLAVELGIPAAVLVCGGFGWLVLSARPWRERDPTRLMVWGVLAMIVLHSLLEYPLWYGPFQLVFGLCLGLLWPAPSVRARPEKFKPNWPAAPVLHAGAAIVLIAIIGYAGWDYTRISQIYLSREARLPAYRDDTLAKIRPSWLFASEVRFAELALTPVTLANAEAVHALAQRTLHFSPEPAVVIKLIESATLLGRQDEGFAHAERLRIAYPVDYRRWLAGKPLLGPGEP